MVVMATQNGKELRVGGHHDCPDYATVVEHEGDADRGVLFAVVVGPNADSRARELVEAVNFVRISAATIRAVVRGRADGQAPG